MASTNFKLFDENKTNMMSDTEYNINTQRLNGVQAGIASSQLQNKTLYQTSLVAYSIAQIMMQNGYDANDSASVSAFVGNMSNSLLQKVLDKATSAEAKAGTITNKWISPATMKAAALLLSGGTMSGSIDMGNNKITNLANPTNPLDSANKKYVDESGLIFEKLKTLDIRAMGSGSNSISCPVISMIGTVIGFLYKIINFYSSSDSALYAGQGQINDLILSQIEGGKTNSASRFILTEHSYYGGYEYLFCGVNRNVVFNIANHTIEFYFSKGQNPSGTIEVYTVKKM